MNQRLNALFTVRLVGGNSSHEGRLEVARYGVWGSVCDDDNAFTDKSAGVVCRSLRFPYVATATFASKNTD